MCLASTSPGGLGSPSVPTMGDCLQWLDAGRMKGGESRLDQGGRNAPCPSPEVRPRGQKSPPWSAGRRARRSQDARRASSGVDCLMRLSALRSPHFSGGDSPVPPGSGSTKETTAWPAPQRQGRRSVGCFTSRARKILPHPEEREAHLEGGQRPDRSRVYLEIGTMSAQVGYSRRALSETRRCAALIP
jgi:hypothetical protein